MREVTETVQLAYMLGFVCLIISLVYVLVALMSRYKSKRHNALVFSALFSTVAVFSGFGIMFSIFLDILGMPSAIGFLLTMLFPLYALFMVCRVSIKAGATILFLSAFCFMGVATDYSAHLNIFTLTKKYSESAYYKILNNFTK